MASIRKRGNSYLIVVSRGYDYQGNRLKSVQRTFHPPEGLTEKQLEKWLNEQAVLFEREAKQEQAPADESITVYGYYQIWARDIAPKKFERSSLLRVTSYIERLMPIIGKVRLKNLKVSDLQDLYDKLRETKSQKHPDRCLQEQTVRGIHHDLSSMLTDAVKGGYIKSNPAFGAYKPKGIKKEVTIADEAMIQKIFAILEQEPLKYELYYKLLITTGMRRAEAAALQWRDIYFEDRSIHIQRSLVSVRGEQWYTKCPKTKAGQRVVYISDKMLYLIKLQMQSMQYFTKKTFNRELQGEDFVFMSEDGSPTRPDTYTHKFSKMIKKYGLDERLTVHSLRHTNASLLISQNVDVTTVANLLGHAQASTTLDIYSHAFDSKKREAREKLEKVLDL